MKRILKWTVILIAEFCAIWYGMGMPIPTNKVEAGKLLLAILVTAYTGWKNHDFTEVAERYTLEMRAEKERLEQDGEADYTDFEESEEVEDNGITITDEEE